MAERMTYDKSIGTEDRSAISATKLWAVVLAIVALIGIAMIVMFLNSGSGRSSGGISSENTMTRPAEP